MAAWRAARGLDGFRRLVETPNVVLRRDVTDRVNRKNEAFTHRASTLAVGFSVSHMPHI